MNVIGIIAEYNPFHNGHLYQINKIKEKYKDSIIIVVLNGNYTERGDISIINKWNKTKILLNHNVDLVVELPTYYGINSSNIFAEGSLEILNNLKIDTLVFGTERDDIGELENIIDIQNSKEFKNELKLELDKGVSYPKAYYDTLKKLTNININTPNDILAFSYLTEIKNKKYNIKPFNIKRTNNYHSKELDSIASATALRKSINNNIDISNYVPSDTLEYINNINLNDYFDIIKYKIITSDLANYHDIKEGIDSRIKKYINESNNIDELISKVKTKRYTYNRIKRILLYILLDIKKDTKINNYIRPLGFNDIGQKYLNSIKKELTLPLVNNYTSNKDLLEFEYKVNLIYSIKSKDDINNELNKPIKK